MTRIRSTFVIHFVLVASMVAVSIWGAFTLPSDVRLPIHWNASLEVDRWAGKTEGLWLMPAIATVLGVVMGLAPRLRRASRGLERSLPMYCVIWLAVTMLFVVLHVSIVGSVGGLGLDPTAALPYGLGVMLVAMGNVMGKLRKNPIAGVRSTATMGSEEVWGKTHRSLGRILVALGLGGLVLALCGYPSIAMRCMAFGTIASSLVARIHAHVLERRRRRMI